MVLYKLNVQFNKLHEHFRMSEEKNSEDELEYYKTIRTLGWLVSLRAKCSHEHIKCLVDFLWHVRKRAQPSNRKMYTNQRTHTCIRESIKENLFKFQYVER